MRFRQLHFILTAALLWLISLPCVLLGRDIQGIDVQQHDWIEIGYPTPEAPLVVDVALNEPASYPLQVPARLVVQEARALPLPDRSTRMGTPTPMATPLPSALAPLPPQCTPQYYFLDEFNGSLSPEPPGWFIVRDDPTTSRVTSSGFFEIDTQSGSLQGSTNNALNILTRDVPPDDFTARTLVSGTPTENFQQGGLIAYGGDDLHIVVGIQHTYGNRRVVGRFEGSSTGRFERSRILPQDAPVYLQMTKFMTNYVVEWSFDGVTWNQLMVVRGAPKMQVGLYAYSDVLGAPSITYSFDYFEIFTCPSDQGTPPPPPPPTDTPTPTPTCTYVPFVRDEFNNATLAPQWQWINENPSNWSLSKNPGFLTIITEEGSLNQLDNSARNLLLRVPQTQDYDVFLKAEGDLNQNFQTAGLIMYEDPDRWLTVQTSYSEYYGRSLEIRLEVGQVVDGVGRLGNDWDPAHFRIMKRSGDLYIAVSEDGINWQGFALARGIFQGVARVGLFAYGDSSAQPVDAKFDWFEIGYCQEPTATPTASPFQTPTPLTPLVTFTPTFTETATPTPPPTVTPTPSVTDTATPVPTETPTPSETPTETPEPTGTPEPTATATPDLCGPLIRMAGWGTTNLQATVPGDVNIRVFVDTYDGVNDIDASTLGFYLGPDPTDCTSADFYGLDAFVTTTTPRGTGFVYDMTIPNLTFPTAGQYLLPIGIQDTAGNCSVLWPYISASPFETTCNYAGLASTLSSVSPPLPPAPPGSPLILMAGYENSALFTDQGGGQLAIEAEVTTGDGIVDVPMYVPGDPVAQLSLGEVVPDASYRLFTPGIEALPPFALYLEMDAIDTDGQRSNRWPYLVVDAAPPTATPQPTSSPVPTFTPSPTPCIGPEARLSWPPIVVVGEFVVLDMNATSWPPVPGATNFEYRIEIQEPGGALTLARDWSTDPILDWAFRIAGPTAVRVSVRAFEGEPCDGVIGTRTFSIPVIP